MQPGSAGFLCLGSLKAKIKMLVRAAVASEAHCPLPGLVQLLVEFSPL